MWAKKTIFSITLLLWIISPAAKSTQLRFITIDVAPWATTDADSGEMVGVFPEVIKEIEERTGHDINITLTPFARIDRELESGRQDCTILITDENRAKLTRQGELLSYHSMGVIARQGVSLKNYSDLQSLTFSVLRGVAISVKFDADSNLKKEFDTDYLIGIRKIAHKRLDAIAGAIPTIRFLADQHGLSEHLGEQLSLEKAPLMLQCSKRSSNLAVMPELNRAIIDMKQDGTLEKIKTRYHFE